MKATASRVYEFGPFRIDSARRVLLRQGEIVPLTPKCFDTLLVLVENSGSLVDKDHLMSSLWPETFVEEGSLTRNIHVLRKALGDDPHIHRFIITVPGQGYRFVADVREMEQSPDEMTVKMYSRSNILIEQQEVVEAEVGQTAARVRRRPAGLSAGSLFVFAMLALIAAAAVYLTARDTEMAATDVTVKSVAVLPFKPLIAGEGNESLEIGMADALINRLGSVRQIIVRPISSVRKYQSLEQHPVAAGREQKVDAVIEGSIQRDGERIRMTVRLLSVKDESTLWTGRFDEQFTNIFRVQDSISEKIAVALAPRLTGEEKSKLARHRTQDIEAYQLYSKGRYLRNKSSEEELKRAIAYLDQAIEKDPDYLDAHVELAYAYYWISGAFMHPGEAMPRARAAARKALEIDETAAEAHTALAMVRAWYDWDWADAEKEFQRALELNPAGESSHHQYGWCLAAMGRGDEAAAELEKARDLDPLSLIINTQLGWAYYLSGHPDEAVRQLQETIEIDKNFAFAHHFLGWVYAEQGMFSEALRELQRARELDDNTETAALMGWVYAASGKKREARNILAYLKQPSRRAYVNPVAVAAIHAEMGEREQAFEWLELAYKDRSDYPCWLKVDPRFDSLRADGKFTEMVRRVGLAP